LAFQSRCSSIEAGFRAALAEKIPGAAKIDPSRLDLERRNSLAGNQLSMEILLAFESVLDLRAINRV
jgi:hypothetical protein